MFIVLVSVPGAAWGNPWLAKREQARQGRAELQEAAQADRAVRAEHAHAQIAALIERVEAGEVVIAQDDLWQLIAGLGWLGEEYLGDLPERLRALNLRGKKTNRAGDQALAATRKAVTDRPWELLRKSVGAGNISLAVGFMWEVLYFDPDYKAIRKALGQKKVSPEKVQKLRSPVQITGELAERLPEIKGLHPNRYWFSPFDAAQMKQGLWWDNRYGWIDARNPERYEKGYLFDLQRKKWTTLEEANSFHAKPGQDWVIRTEHLLITGTAELEKLVQVADQLEAMYDEIFISFPNFFTESKRVDAMRYALGLAEHKPFEIWVYASHPEYVERAGAADWSAGIFRPSNGTAYFYGGPSTTMYHEFTHQVLRLMTGRNRAPTWLTEGIAEYTETVQFGSRGAEFPGAAPDASWTIDDLIALGDSGEFYRATKAARKRKTASPYRGSGSVVTFTMQMGGEVYRTDFVDYLRDSYRGNVGKRQVWEYMGMSKAEFERTYAQWVRQKMGDG